MPSKRVKPWGVCLTSSRTTKRNWNVIFPQLRTLSQGQEDPQAWIPMRLRKPASVWTNRHAFAQLAIAASLRDESAGD